MKYALLAVLGIAATINTAVAGETAFPGCTAKKIDRMAKVAQASEAVNATMKLDQSLNNNEIHTLPAACRGGNVAAAKSHMAEALRNYQTHISNADRFINELSYLLGPKPRGIDEKDCLESIRGAQTKMHQRATNTSATAGQISSTCGK